MTYFIRACVEIFGEFALTLKLTVKAKPALCGKEGDKLWITGGKMLSSEQASQLFYEMNAGKRVSLPKEPLYEHRNEESLYYQSRYDLKTAAHICGVSRVNCSKKSSP